jgi:hypothetical protein
MDRGIELTLSPAGALRCDEVRQSRHSLVRSRTSATVRVHHSAREVRPHDAASQPRRQPTSRPTAPSDAGRLALPDGTVTRPKPLLPWAYLPHEGPTDRDRLARLFFVDCDDPRDVLSTTMRRLAGLARPLGALDTRVHIVVTTDALALETLALEARPDVAIRSYVGPFLQGLSIPQAERRLRPRWLVTAAFRPRPRWGASTCVRPTCTRRGLRPSWPTRTGRRSRWPRRAASGCSMR